MGLLAYRRGVGKGWADARWLAEAGCAGKRPSGLGSSPSRASGEPVLQGIVAVPHEVVGCGGDVVEAGGADDCEGEIAEGSVVCRAVAGVHPARDLPEGGVAPAVVLDFKGPMSAVEGEETLRRCLCMGERGDPVRWRSFRIWRAFARGSCGTSAARAGSWTSRRAGICIRWSGYPGGREAASPARR